MFTEDELLPISALPQLAYCERRCALIHLEQQWEDNRFTVEGEQLHERVHDGGSETRPGIRVARGVRIRSLRLGLTGQADVVEFHRVAGLEDPASAEAVALPGLAGWWRPFPVEYKRGRPKPDYSDEVQLCAQALCLEEMLGVRIPEGALYYGQPRRRSPVRIDQDLRRETEKLAARLHQLWRARKTPLPVYTSRCRSCSLVDVCLPRAVNAGRSVAVYLASALEPPAEGEAK